MYYIFALLLTTNLVSCASETDNSKQDKNKDKQKDQAKNLGQKVPAPMINIGEFSEMSKADLRLARNTVFAKYGRIFKSKDLKEHFAKQDWYNENPSFKQSDMSDQDVDLVKLIQRWEEKTSILLEEQADITGNGSYENCFVLYNKNKGTYSIVINDFSQEFDHFWGQADDSQGLPSDWTEINAQIVDIESEDVKQEGLVSQRYDDWEDPGTHNVVVAFDNGVQVTELSSTDYDSGILTLNEDGTVTMQQSNCPEHTKDYRLEKGKLVMFDETIGPTPRGGCAACFSGESLVATSVGNSKRIEDLKRGDYVLTYNQKTKAYSQTRVKRILTVYHNNLVEINLNNQSIVVTDDHPFLTDEGWASLNPTLTESRYGYDNVQLLTTKSKLIGLNSISSQIEEINSINQGMMTYTISTVEFGNTFIIHGVVVGTETIETEHLSL